MRKPSWIGVVSLTLTRVVWFADAAAVKIDTKNLLVGKSALLDYSCQKPGTFRKITVDSLAEPFSSPSSANAPKLVPRPADA